MNIKQFGLDYFRHQFSSLDNHVECSFWLWFSRLFVEKFKEHPGYKDLGEADKKLMRSYCKKVLPLAEQIKTGLLQQYEEEFKTYLEETERLRAKAEEERRRNEEDRNKRIASNKDSISASAYAPSAPPIYQPSAIDRDFKPLPGYNIPGEYDTPQASVITIPKSFHDLQLTVLNLFMVFSVEWSCSKSPIRPDNETLTLYIPNGK